MVEIFFIHSPGCLACETSSSMLDAAILKSGVECEVRKFEFDPDAGDENSNTAAIAIAANNNIDEIPGFIIGPTKQVFLGTSYTESELIKAIEDAVQCQKKKKK